MRRLIIFGFLIMFLSLSTAHTDHSNSDEHVETVLIASSANYPDSFISQPASETIGAPVLITEKDQLSESTANSLEDLEVEEAILVGGPAVLSEDVEEEIDSTVNSTTRIWGTTQIGTSVEVSEYFWPENKKATVVQYPQGSEDGYKLLSKVTDEVDDEPVLISKEGTLSASTVSELERLNASEVDVFSTDALNVTEDLESIGVEEVEIEEGSIENLTDFEENKLDESEKEENRSRMVIVGASGFKDVLSVPSSRGSALIIDDENRISKAVVRVQNSSVEQVYVTGQPELADSIAARLREETDKKVVLTTGEPENVASDFAERNGKEWSKEQEERLGKWREKVKKAPGIQRSANKTIRNADRVIDGNSTERTRTILQEAKDEYQNGDYFEARKLAIEANSIARSERFRSFSAEEVEEEVNNEREDIRETTKEFRELGKKQSDRLKEAETVEERLEVIREFREERREQARELRDEKKKGQKEKTEKRERNETERFRQDEGDADEIGSSEISLEVDGNQLKAEGRYTGSTAGYTENLQVKRTDGKIRFSLELRSPEGPAAQVVSDYRVEKETEVEDGNYTATVNLLVDGEILNSFERDIRVPSNSEYENEVETETDEEQEETSEENESEDDENVVRYSTDGFSPKRVKVERGEDVQWVNEGSREMWIASDNHPRHTIYSGSQRTQHCQNGESETFDQCSTGKRYEFEFEKTGEWSYHNHEFASDGGTVIVEQKN